MVDLLKIRKAIIALLDGHTGRIEYGEDDSVEFAVIQNPDDDGNPLKGHNPYIVIDLKELKEVGVVPLSNKELEKRQELADPEDDGREYSNDDWWNDYFDGPGDADAYEAPA